MSTALKFPLYASSGFGTRCIHGGQSPDIITGAVTTPISLATTYVQRSPGEHSGYEYSRTGNPTRHTFEAAMASIECGQYALAFASGSATTATITALLKSGDHIVSVDDVYGGTNRYFSKVAAPSANVSTTFVDFTDLSAVEAAIRPTTRLLWLESPTNPTLKVADIAAAARISKRNACLLVVDNTFASPAIQTPLMLGADIVVHSVTKYLGGHSDVVMGVAVMNDVELYSRLKFLQNAIGAVPAPFDCYMALRGLKTLHLRMRAHCANALAVAQFLERRAEVALVVYPGLISHPQHQIAKKQMRDGFGGIVTFHLHGDIQHSRVFLSALSLFACAESLGAVESLADHPAIMTHASVPPEQRRALGITDSLVRLSVGVEDADDLIADLSSALNAVTAQFGSSWIATAQTVNGDTNEIARAYGTTKRR